MPAKEEKLRRKQLAQRRQAVNKQDFLENLPISLLLFRQLFKWLDENLDGNCDDTLWLTQQFAVEKHVQFEPLKIWLRSQGGYCDCAVLTNVEEQFEQFK